MIELIFAMAGAAVGLFVGIWIAGRKTADHEEEIEKWRFLYLRTRQEKQALKSLAACGHPQDAIEHDDLPLFAQ